MKVFESQSGFELTNPSIGLPPTRSCLDSSTMQLLRCLGCCCGLLPCCRLIPSRLPLCLSQKLVFPLLKTISRPLTLSSRQKPSLPPTRRSSSIRQVADIAPRSWRLPRCCFSASPAFSSFELDAIETPGEGLEQLAEASQPLCLWPSDQTDTAACCLGSHPPHLFPRIQRLVSLLHLSCSCFCPTKPQTGCCRCCC